MRVVGFVFLLAAIWIGLWFSDKLVAPIVRLLDAARRVSGGELDAKVDSHRGPGRPSDPVAAPST